MRRYGLVFGFCCVLFLPAPTPCFSADPATGGQDGNAVAEICFPRGEGDAILKDLDGYDACMDAVNACDDDLEAEEKRAVALESRVKETEGELVRAEKIIEDTRKAGEQAANTPWWQRLLRNSKAAGGAAGGAALGAVFGGPGGAAVGGALGAIIGYAL